MLARRPMAVAESLHDDAGPTARKRARRLPPLHVVALALILAGGVALRVAFMWEPMRYDEAWSFTVFAIGPWRTVTLNYAQANNHVLNTILMHSTWRVFGDGLWVIRGPVFVAGSLVPLAAYAAVRRLRDSNAALWAAALTATSAPLIDFSVNARGYIWQTACVALLVPLILAGRRGGWAGALTALGAFAARSMLVPAAGLFAGVSGLRNGAYDRAGRFDLDVIDVDVGFRRGGWDFRSEFARTNQEVPGGTIRRRGFYTQLAYRAY